MPKKKKGLLEKISWKAIIGAIVTGVSLYFGIPEYILNLRPVFSNRIGSDNVSFIEGAILGAIVIVIALKLYAQLTEDKQDKLPKTKTTASPILRITPLLGQLFPLTHIAMKINIENIVPNSIAKNIVIKCKFIPDKSIVLKNNGVFEHKLPITYKDPPVTIEVLGCEDRDKLFAQKFVYEATYLNEYNKKTKQKDEMTLAGLVIKLEKDVKREKFPSSEAFFPKS